MYYVYAIKSCTRYYVYVGISDTVERRFQEHQRDYNRTTKPYRPFALLYVEKCDNRIKAREREKYFKSGVRKEFLKSI